jgi:hypothetical protein
MTYDCVCQHVGYCDGSCQFSEQDANLPTPGFWERVDTADYAEIHPEGKKAEQAIALVGKGADADLIAAAPLMFWALQEAHKVFRFYDRYHEDKMAVLGIERALKVARGEK